MQTNKIELKIIVVCNIYPSTMYNIIMHTNRIDWNLSFFYRVIKAKMFRYFVPCLKEKK